MSSYDIEDVLSDQKINIDNMSKFDLIKIKQLIINNPECLKTLEKIFNKTKIYNNIELHSIKTPYWFEKDTNFEDNIWNINIANKKSTISFNDIKIDNNKYLIENIELLNTFKYWLCIQGHPIFNKGLLIKPETLQSNLSNTIDFINYILLNAEKLQLSKLSLLCIDNSFIIDFLINIGTKGKYDGIYNFSLLTEEYLKNNIKNLKLSELHEFEKKYPLLNINYESNKLNLDINDIRKARFWIHINKINISEKLYKGKILNTNKRFPSFDELRISANINTEYPRLSVTTSTENDFSYQVLQTYIKTIKSLTLVHLQEDYAQLLNFDLKEINIKRINREINLKRPGRYVTLPADTTFKAIKDSFEYIHKNMDFLQDLILDFYIFKEKFPNSTFQQLIEHHPLKKKIDEFGIKRLNNTKAFNYFINLRNNSGLIESYNIMLACCLVLIGALTARRMSEILELDAFNCIIPNNINPILNKNTEFEIVFENRKSGIGGEYFHREKLARPIPRSVAIIIYKLQEFNKKIIKHKFIKKDNLSLFNFLNINKLKFKKLSFQASCEILNNYCDYFETKIILEDSVYKRYYIRQHQLRRFFAMMFFWSKGFDGLDTLRYLLGHTDIEHLYHYITEPITGAVLNGVKAHTLTEAYLGTNKIKIQNIEFLREILLNHFKITDIELLDFNLLNSDKNKKTILNKISYLIDEHIIDLKPNFFTITISKDEIIQDYELIMVIEDNI
ncbi:hypothetical protein R4606_13865 [Acinetobacter baumannii]|nr:hypothetical protein [Acinetobacter baumannii]